TYSNFDVYPILENINSTLVGTLKSTETASIVNKETTATDSSQNEDNLLANLGANNSASTDTSATAVNMEAQNPLFSVLMPSVYQAENGQQQLAPGPQVGIANLRDTAKVNAYLARPEVKSLLPANLKFLW